jgi:hypothetical protein
MKKTLLLILLLAISGFSQDRPESKLGKILYRTGQVALVLANSFDVGSSWGKHELNPLLASQNGTFGARAASIKIGVVGLGIVGSELVLRKHPRLKPYVSFADYTVAAVETAAAMHNLGYSQQVLIK